MNQHCILTAFRAACTETWPWKRSVFNKSIPRSQNNRKQLQSLLDVFLCNVYSKSEGSLLSLWAILNRGLPETRLRIDSGLAVCQVVLGFTAVCLNDTTDFPWQRKSIRNLRLYRQ